MRARLTTQDQNDSAPYTKSQLDTLTRGRTRVRIPIGIQADGTLKGYGFNTQTCRDWEMIPVVHVKAQGSNPLYPLGYKDFILVFPAKSGINPVYAVINFRSL